MASLHEEIIAKFDFHIMVLLSLIFKKFCLEYFEGKINECL